MDIGATLTLSEVSKEAGVEFLDDPETTIATVAPPTEVGESEIAEETELVGDDAQPDEAAAEDGAPEGGDSGDE